MSRGGLAAILISLVMVMVGAVPIMAGTYEVVKGSQGPNASVVTWTYVAQDYCVWTAHIVNNGLKSLTIDVYDNTTGVPQEIMHQRIRFAAHNAYPVGDVETQGAVMAAGRIYVMTATPNGPRGASCTITDSYRPPPPVAMFSVELTGLQASFDASGSYDPLGMITSYDWDFGDGEIGSGVKVDHTYPGWGTYTVVLTVTNEAGSTASAIREITISDMPPTASFTYTMNGSTVEVNASNSIDDNGIVSYEWDWGDGTTTTGMTATHTYSTSPTTMGQTPSEDTSAGRGSYLFWVWGYATYSDGTAALNCDVKITNLRTGMSFWTTSDSVYGYYEYYLVTPVTCVHGDTLNVTASMYEWYGQNEGMIDVVNSGSVCIDVVLAQTNVMHSSDVTLRVTDTVGQTAEVTENINFERELVAQFTFQVSGRHISVDASPSIGTSQITSYTWSWGDGWAESTDSPSYSHSYSAFGQYTVTLSVHTAIWQADSVSRVVWIWPIGSL